MMCRERRRVCFEHSIHRAEWQGMKAFCNDTNEVQVLQCTLAAQWSFFALVTPAKQFSGSSSYLVHCISNHFFSAVTATQKGAV